MTQWNTRPIGGGLEGFDPKTLDEVVVILMRGKNPFGDQIYSYVKLTVKDLMNMQATARAGKQFNPSDYGTVVAAGKGEPTPEIRAEVESTYKVLSSGRAPQAEPATPAAEHKSWDEF